MANRKIMLPYNPLTYRNLSDSIQDALIQTKRRALADAEQHEIPGAGIYVLYYGGPFPAYTPIVEFNKKKTRKEIDRRPIYIGEAAPEGKRSGHREADSATGKELQARLRKHRKVIHELSSLRVQDFEYRFLQLDPAWTDLGESALIHRYQPAWNVVVTGFGNNVVGKHRVGSAASAWQTLHLKNTLMREARLETYKMSRAELVESVRDFLMTTIRVIGADRLHPEPTRDETEA